MKHEASLAYVVDKILSTHSMFWNKQAEERSGFPRGVM